MPAQANVALTDDDLAEVCGNPICDKSQKPLLCDSRINYKSCICCLCIKTIFLRPPTPTNHKIKHAHYLAHCARTGQALRRVSSTKHFAFVGITLDRRDAVRGDRVLAWESSLSPPRDSDIQYRQRDEKSELEEVTSQVEMCQDWDDPAS